MKTKKIVSLTVGFFALGIIAAALAICAIYPNKYANDIDAAANEFELDGALVRSVIWAESKFDARATSSKGAQGLMQLMPETFDECATALGIVNADPFAPVDNLRCGCYYLRLMLDKFDGDTENALAAYNAGEANARKFISGELDMFAETCGYIKAVNRANKFYCIISNR